MVRYKVCLTLALSAILHMGRCAPAETIPEEVSGAVVKIGGSAAGELMSTLKAHLEEALASGDTVAAFEACAVSALTLTSEVQDRLPPGVTVKRTSFRTRNPANAPDELEAVALRWFEDASEIRSDLPEDFVQAVDQNREYRYDMPLRVGEPCLKCHGPLEDLDPALRESLQENYPEDRATGYRPGDFRGVVRVSIPAEMIEGRRAR